MCNSNKNKRLMNMATLILLFGCIIVLLVISYIKYDVFDAPVSSILDDVISDIPGTLLSIIIFNIAYEYLTKDEAAEEISERVASVLLGNPEVMESFEKDTRLTFIQSTMTSLIGSEKADIVYGLLEPYVCNDTLCYKKNFHYHIYIDDNQMGNIFDSSNYLTVSEYLSYERYCDEKFDAQEVCIGFFPDENDLKDVFKDKTFVFRESLKIKKADLEYLCNLNDADKNKFVEQKLNVSLLINNEDLKINEVKITDKGIVVSFLTDKVQIDNSYTVRVAFNMPLLRNSYLLVVISEMTLSPNVWLRYNSQKMSISAYEFLDQDPQQINDSDSVKGNISICPHGWIYPVRGIVFTIDDKEDTDTCESETDTNNREICAQG